MVGAKRRGHSPGLALVLTVPITVSHLPVTGYEGLFCRATQAFPGLEESGRGVGEGEGGHKVDNFSDSLRCLGNMGPRPPQDNDKIVSSTEYIYMPFGQKWNWGGGNFFSNTFGSHEREKTEICSTGKQKYPITQDTIFYCVVVKAHYNYGTMQHFSSLCIQECPIGYIYI